MKTSQLSTAQIVIPTFNRAQLLLKTLNSALNQTLSFDRIIISDNSDSAERQHETRRIVAKHLANYQNLLVLQRHQNHSQHRTTPSSFKICIVGHSTTPCFAWWWHAWTRLLAKLKPYLDSDRKLVAVAANAWMVNSDKTRIGTLMRMRSGVLR